MSDEYKCAGYCRVGNLSQADEQTEKKLETVRVLQEIGYKVAVAPVNFQGDNDSLSPIPPLNGRCSSDTSLEEAHALLRGEQTLVITGMRR